MILELKNIIKKFDGIKALDDVSFSIKKGEVHIIAGENGAGKSTLIKIISGIHKPDSGTVVIDGEAVETFNPLIAREKGIATIFQETSIYPQLSVVENVYVNNKIKKNPFFVDWEKMIEGSSKIFKELGEELNLRGNMNGYSAGRCKIVEIARALIKNSRIIIMDEPTSSLSESEVEKLFENIDRLKKAGVTIIYITHKLEEIFKIGDSITVLRDGKCIGTKRIKDISDDELIEMMIGRKIQNYFPNINDNNGDCILKLRILIATLDFSRI